MSKCGSKQQAGLEIQKSTNTKLFRDLFYETDGKLQAIMELNQSINKSRFLVYMDKQSKS